jgi:hypothetical protein
LEERDDEEKSVNKRNYKHSRMLSDIRECL